MGTVAGLFMIQLDCGELYGASAYCFIPAENYPEAERKADDLWKAKQLSGLRVEDLPFLSPETDILREVTLWGHYLCHRSWD